MITYDYIYIIGFINQLIIGGPHCRWYGYHSQIGGFIANLKDTLQKIRTSLLMNVDFPIDTKRLVRISFYPSKIDLVDMSASENVLYPPNGNFDWEHYDKPQVFVDLLCSRKATSVDIPVISSLYMYIYNMI